MLPHNIVINPNLAQFGTFERTKIRIHSRERNRLICLINEGPNQRPKSLKHHVH